MLRILKEKRGVVTFLFETITLYVVIYLFSFLYKSYNIGPNAMGDRYYSVYALTGILAILLVVAATLLYTNEFYMIQMKLQNEMKTGKRAILWVLYIVSIIFQVVITFILFIYNIEGDKLTLYIFQSEGLNNIMFIFILGILVPCSYLWIFLIRKIIILIKKR